jgi:hypothetical protein
MILTMIKRLPALLLLVACVLLVQQHSIEFWRTKAGLDYWQAMHWSVLLEAGSAWLITRRVWWQTIFALCLSLIVITGPLYQVSNELIVTLNAPANTIEIQTKLEALLVTQIEQQANSLETFNKNSETRAGWLGAIKDANTQLATNQEELKAFYESQLVAEEPTWVAAAILAMQAISLVIFQLLIIFTTRSGFAPVRHTRPAAKQQATKAKAQTHSKARKTASRPTTQGKSGLELVKAAAANMRQVRAA